MLHPPDTTAGRCLWLAVAIAGAALLAVVPSRLAFGSGGVLALVLSAWACFVPGCVVFLLSAYAGGGRSQVRAIVWGTGLRIASAATAALLMDVWLDLAPANYLIWLGLFYLVALVVETWFVVAPTPARCRTPRV